MPKHKKTRLINDGLESVFFHLPTPLFCLLPPWIYTCTSDKKGIAHRTVISFTYTWNCRNVFCRQAKKRRALGWLRKRNAKKWQPCLTIYPLIKKCFTLLPKWSSYKNISMPKIAVTRGRHLIRTQCKFFVVHWFDVGFVEYKWWYLNGNTS